MEAGSSAFANESSKELKDSGGDDNKGEENSDDVSSTKISSSDWNIVKPKSSKDNEKQTVAKEGTNHDDGDDLPGDFFDDFLKEDFMAGLDVVDEDEEVDDKSVAQLSKRVPKPLKQAPAFKGPIKPKLRNEDNKQESFMSDSRRDPSKTKRDIERDKERCVKDKEKKLITEKLALVETGLVPPGMEMEIDVEEIRRQRNEIEQIKEKVEKLTRTASRSPRRRSSPYRRSLSRDRSSPKRKRSPIARKRSSVRSSPRKSDKRSPRRSPRRSPYRKRSPLKKISPPMRRVFSTDIPRGERSLSPILRDERRSSPRRGKSRDRKSLGRKISPIRRRRSPLIRRSRSRSRSPYFRGGRRRSPSPIHRRRSLSREQERRRRRSRTRSPKRSRKDEKKSFLEEIVEKLNDTSSRPSVHMQVMPITQPAAVPIQPAPMVQQYVPAPPPVNVPVVAPIPVPAPVPPPAQVRPDFLPQQTQKYDLNFFIGDGSPPTNSHRPQRLHQILMSYGKKLKEAIKYLSRSENKFSGRLCIQKTQVVPSADKNSSPLKRMTQVKIPFTEPPTKAQNTSAFSGCIDRLLKHLGIQSETIEIDDKEDRASSPPPPPPPSITKPAPVEQSARSSCPDCERRKKKVFKNSGTQYSDDRMTYSVSTQVSEDDLNPNRIPKNQSIASLTPAQLLGKSKYGASKMDKDEFDILPQRSEGFLRGPSGRGREGYGGGGGRNNLESDYRYRF
nr:unnamed protein product [Callosobruchus analis]